jgi:hypothetical protein
LAVTGPVDCEPDTFLLPVHAPEAVQAVAFMLVQVRLDEAPELTVGGMACSTTCGGEEVTVTVVDWVADPPGPVQVNTYSVLLDSLPVTQVPLVAIDPCQPPLPTQSVAPVVCQVSVEVASPLMVVGEADRLMTGAG